MANRFHLNKASAGFTLVELLTVMTIITLLLGSIAGAATRARRLAKVSKAESELRELINACQQYMLYDSDTGDELATLVNKTSGTGVEVNKKLLEPLMDVSKNNRHVIYYNGNLVGDKMLDPWGNPYRLTYATPKNSTSTRDVGMSLSVSFPNYGRIQ